MAIEIADPLTGQRMIFIAHIKRLATLKFFKNDFQLRQISPTRLHAFERFLES